MKFSHHLGPSGPSVGLMRSVAISEIVDATSPRSVIEFGAIVFGINYNMVCYNT